MKSYLFLLSALAVSCTGTALRVYNVCDYGASGDGVADCTEAFDSAIGKCSADGGGRVDVPAGTYLCRTIFLRDNVELFLEEGAVVSGCPDADSYSSFVPEDDLTKYDSGAGTLNANNSRDARWNRALIIGDRVRNVTISGKGVIDGNHVRDSLGEEHMRGPHTILLAQCSDVVIKDISITRASNYAVMGYALENAVFKNIHITEGWDGIHVRGAENMVISDCVLETGDDCIAGGFWHNATIAGCSINSSCNGIRMIMPSVGVTVKDSYFTGPGHYPHRTSGGYRTLFGITLEPGAWGPTSGRMDDIVLENLKMDSVSSPLSVSIRKGVTAGTLTVRDVEAAGIYGTLSPVVSWNDCGFESIVVENFKITRK